MDIISILRIVLVISIVVIIIFLLKWLTLGKKIKRISYYSLEPLYDKSLSFSDRIRNIYMGIIKSFRGIVGSSKYLSKRSKKYEKYIKYNLREEVLAIDFIINKFGLAIVSVIFTFLSQAFTGKVISIYDFIISFLIGYYILDIYFFFSYKKERKLMENELLRAVIIMNNSFKSGMSILQALKRASNELPEPICDEFKKMYLDMKFGLSVDTVFDRFAKRVNLEEATYISSSLMILNKTGGNIVEVFSSIERTLFDKRKLNEELKNIAASPNMVVKILLAVPIVFVLFIYVLNPTYFDPLFSSSLGYVIMGIIVIMFVVYALLLRRILKIEV